MKLLVLALSTLPVQLLAQADTAAALRTPPPTYTSNLGIGLGIDHGGIGLQLQYRPVPPLAFFVGGGYALAGLGYNLGMQVRLLPKKKWCPYVAGMYGAAEFRNKVNQIGEPDQVMAMIAEFFDESLNRAANLAVQEPQTETVH